MCRGVDVRGWVRGSDKGESYSSGRTLCQGLKGLGHVSFLGTQLRKGTAPAFNAANLKAEFPATVESAMGLVRSLRAREGAAVDVDRAAQRQAMDVIGRVGFDRDFGATGELSGHAGGLNEDPFELLDAGSIPCGTRGLIDPGCCSFFPPILFSSSSPSSRFHPFSSPFFPLRVSSSDLWQGWT